MNLGQLDALSGFNPLNIYDNYASWTDTVAKYPPTAEPFYLALGITDEVGELVTAETPDDVLKEAGDSLWYCARYSVRVLKLPFSSMIDAMRHSPGITLDKGALRAVGLICGVEKKRIRDGAGWDLMTAHNKMRVSRDAVVDVLVFIHAALARHGFTIGDALDANQGKLKARLAAGTIQGDGDHR